MVYTYHLFVVLKIVNGGQCGICVVEIEGQDRLARSCCIKAKEGMVI